MDFFYFVNRQQRCGALFDLHVWSNVLIGNGKTFFLTKILQEGDEREQKLPAFIHITLFYIIQSGGCRAGKSRQAYCSHSMRETLIRYGGRHFLVCRNPLIMQEGSD